MGAVVVVELGIEDFLGSNNPSRSPSEPSMGAKAIVAS